MTRKNNQQEILLLATPGFSATQLFYSANHECSSGQLSILERLAEACWSGLLREMIPEIIQQAESGKSLCTWHIGYGTTTLQILLSDAPPVIEPAFSIDPQYFLAGISYN